MRISEEQATKVKEYSEKHELTKALLYEIVKDDKPKARKFVMKNDIISKYFSAETSIEEIEKTVYMLLEEWSKKKH